jgi:hypothetical protein
VFVDIPRDILARLELPGRQTFHHLPFTHLKPSYGLSTCRLSDVHIKTYLIKF